MISDSPYKTGELVLKPVSGILGGLVGAIVMIVSIRLFEPVSKNSLNDVLGIIGNQLPFQAIFGLKTDFGQTIAGAILLLISGGVLGLFYALSEQRIPPKGLIADGLFYGLILWILGGVIFTSFLGDEIRVVLRSWIFLIHTLLYGLCLAMFSVLAMRGQPAGPVTPRD